MRVAVIGHVEWIEFARVDRVPAPGEIVNAMETWEESGSAASVAAVQLAKLGGDVTLFTALGDDELGHRAKGDLEHHGVRVEAALRPEPQRRCFVFLDAQGERTITTLGPRMGPRGDDPLPWDELAGTAAVYFTAGDGGSLRAGRRARVLTATSRVFGDLVAARVPLDAVIGSDLDPGERYVPGALDPPPRVVALTRGAAGGTFSVDGGPPQAFRAVPIPGPVADAYGSGDSFAAGFTFGLAAGMSVEEAIALGARCGAASLTGRGSYQGQLRLPP